MSSKKDDRILTQHPTGKQGTRIERAKYDAMKRAILKVVARRGEGTPFKELSSRVRPHLADEVYGPDVSVGWYCTTVKLDLEARGLLERVPGVSPQRLLRL